jgi:hypothetical protein
MKSRDSSVSNWLRTGWPRCISRMRRGLFSRRIWLFIAHQHRGMEYMYLYIDALYTPFWGGVWHRLRPHESCNRERIRIALWMYVRRWLFCEGPISQPVRYIERRNNLIKWYNLPAFHAGFFFLQFRRRSLPLLLRADSGLVGQWRLDYECPRPSSE